MSVLEDTKTKVVGTDVLVLGGGIGGCSAAIRARESGSEVVMVDKGNVGRSGFSPMMSGILLHFDPEEDDYDAWFKEVVETSEWLIDQKRLDLIIKESTD